VQCVPVKETERTDGLNVRGEFDPLFIEQEQLPRPDLFRAELVGWLVEVLGELGDRADVSSHGRRGIVANAEILQHPLSECSHR